MTQTTQPRVCTTERARWLTVIANSCWNVYYFVVYHCRKRLTTEWLHGFLWYQRLTTRGFPCCFLLSSLFENAERGGNKKKSGCLIQLASSTKVTTLWLKQLICLAHACGHDGAGGAGQFVQLSSRTSQVSWVRFLAPL